MGSAILIVELFGCSNSDYPIDSKEDTRATRYLAEGKYDQFFDMDPDKLSDSVYNIALNQAEDMVKFNQECQELEDFLNALIGNDSEKVSKHLLNLSNVTSLRNTQNNLLLQGMAGLGENNEEFLAIKEQAKKNRSLQNLWEVLYVLQPENSTKMASYGQDDYNVPKKIQTTIDNLTIDYNGNSTFDYKTKETWEGRSREQSDNSSITAEHVDTKKALDSADHAIKLANIREAQANYVNKVIGEGLLFAAGVFVPGFSKGQGIIESIKNVVGKNEASQVKGSTDLFGKGLDHYIKNKYGADSSEYKNSQKAIAGVSSTLNNLASWSEGFKQLKAEEYQAKQDILYDLIDGGGTIGTKDDEIITAKRGDLDYEQQSRLDELMNNGYKSYFETCGAGDDLVLYLSDSKNEVDKNVVKFITEGGDPSKIDIDKIRNALNRAIETINSYRPDETQRIDENIMENWFKKDGGYQKSLINKGQQ